MKSEWAVNAALRPTVGPFRAVMRILGWVEKAWVVCYGWMRQDWRMEMECAGDERMEREMGAYDVICDEAFEPVFPGIGKRFGW